MKKLFIMILILTACGSSAALPEEPIETTTTETPVLDEIFCKEYSSEYTYQFFPNTKHIELRLNNLPEHYGITDLSIYFEILNRVFPNTLGHELHFEDRNRVKLNTEYKEFKATLPYSMPMGTFTIDNLFIDIDLHATFSDGKTCKIGLIKSLDTTFFEKASDNFVKPWWEERVALIRFFSNTDKFAEEEMNYIGPINDDLDTAINIAGEDARYASPEALFLASHSWNEDLQMYSYRGLRRAVAPITIGLYVSKAFSGPDMSTDSLWAYVSLIDRLKIVAPDLDIKLATYEHEVTLPVHFSTCRNKNVVSKKLDDCGEKGVSGYYFLPISPEKLEKRNHGWIWIDSSLSFDGSLLIFFHEIAHALGVNHNKCPNSEMNNESFNYSLTNLDYAVISALYNNDFNFKIDPRDPTEERYDIRKESNLLDDLLSVDPFESHPACDVNVESFNIEEKFYDVYKQVTGVVAP